MSGPVALSLESPEPLVPTDISIPEVYRAAVQQSDTYSTEIQSPFFMLLANSYTYVKGIEISALGAVEGIVARFGQRPGVSDLTYKTFPTSVSGVPGLLFAGSFVHHNTTFVFRGVAIARISRMHSPCRRCTKLAMSKALVGQ